MADLCSQVRDRPIVWTTPDDVLAFAAAAHLERLRLVKGCAPSEWFEAWTVCLTVEPIVELADLPAVSAVTGP